MGLLDGLLTCKQHRCPMITVGENYCCAIEYTNDLIGTQQVVSVIPGLGEMPTQLVFANGGALPLLCPDCGEPLHIYNDKFVDDIVGLYLFALSYVPSFDESPEGSMEFVFTLSLSDDGLAENELPEDSQSILLHLDSVRGIKLLDDMPEPDDFMDEVWSDREGMCQACDRFGPVDDMSLCENCATKFERDLIRQRAWDYSAMAFGVPAEKLEELRRQIIAQFGEELELLAPSEKAPAKRGTRQKPHRRRKVSRSRRKK